MGVQGSYLGWVAAAKEAVFRAESLKIVQKELLHIFSISIISATSRPVFRSIFRPAFLSLRSSYSVLHNASFLPD